MKKFSRMIGSILLSVLLASPCISQGFHYDGPEDNKWFFAIGWSKDGKRLAYGRYKNEQSPVSDERICNMSVVIQDIVKDSTLWVNAKDWSSSDSDFPQSAKQAWLYFDNLSHINEEVWRHGIEVVSPDAMINEVSGNTIYLENDLLTVDTKVFENDNEYFKKFEVRVTSKNLGEKVITSGEIPHYREGITLEGYMFNPDKSRMALILSEVGGAEYDPQYFIVGCHLRAGFIMTGK